MLHVGLTGGIGSGKSTVARRLAQHGAVVIDADALAREVVSPGTSGLEQVRLRFGDDVIGPHGELDRRALASIVFDDEKARADLESITHPLVAARTAELLATTGEQSIVVHDVPLLVENHLGPDYHLVVVVEASPETRVQRLTGLRGMPEADALARMAHQAGDEQRTAAADVVLGNDGSLEQLEAAVDQLWAERLSPYEENLWQGRLHVQQDLPVTSSYKDEWPQQAERVIERLSRILGARAPELEHVGSTSVPGMPGKDVIDIQIGVTDLRSADDPEFVEALARAGFPRVDKIRMDHPTGELLDPSLWVKRFHGSCDPGRIVHIHVREADSAGWQSALLFRDWLRANPDAADEYVEVKNALSAQSDSARAYADAKEPWFEEIWPRITAWAQKTGWRS
ncbi:dephospho-CoA kinase [Austwickia chelonae]|uniref:Dephospho-CoA kinase n=1 Tax=Austwickia chelonae NBRC 105200 TaxID=1184607 RepID=K6W5X6_9MICO|nr:dephospho-CoA kinase [Austwickia chelonae]GAB77227.1 dephospho-CoA kinase [Austwickia chelonae NBRC 105200]SEW05606.1 dephospho-CoA kinase [Austwickia chelonae]